MSDLEDMTAAYLECALWTASDECEQPLDQTYPYISDFTSETAERAKRVCEAFLTLYGQYIEQAIADVDGPACDYAQAGHDLWLTRNGHGTGFWDRGIGYAGDKLTEAAKTLGEANVCELGESHGGFIEIN